MSSEAYSLTHAHVHVGRQQYEYLKNSSIAFSVDMDRNLQQCTEMRYTVAKANEWLMS